MTTRDLDNHPMAYSRLAGREVSTWSEEWKHECEIAYLARLSPEKLRAMLYGVQGAQDESVRGDQEPSRRCRRGATRQRDRAV